MDAMEKLQAYIKVKNDPDIGGDYELITLVLLGVNAAINNYRLIKKLEDNLIRVQKTLIALGKYLKEKGDNNEH